MNYWALLVTSSSPLRSIEGVRGSTGKHWESMSEHKGSTREQKESMREQKETMREQRESIREQRESKWTKWAMAKEQSGKSFVSKRSRVGLRSGHIDSYLYTLSPKEKKKRKKKITKSKKSLGSRVKSNSGQFNSPPFPHYPICQPR